VYQYKDHLGSVRLTYADSNNDGVITPSTEIIEEANYFPFGARHKGYNSNVSSSGNSLAQKRGFNGKELNDDLLGGNRLDWYDFGARNYDADLGRWMNLDPLSEKYFDSSPYHYAANNPIFYVDPDGKQIDVSDILKKNKKGEYVNKDLAKAFLNFAKTDLGKEILGMFAGAGQKIEGTDIEFKEDGAFHSQGINLHVRTADTMNDSNNKGANGTTALSLNPRSGKGRIDVFINSKANENNEYAKNYKNNPDDPKAKQLYILSRAGTIFHETIIHGVGPAKDLTDDCKLNCSDVRPSIRKSSSNSSLRRHTEGAKKGSMFYDKGIPAIQKLHKKQKSGIPSSKVKSGLLNYIKN
jgi:RHS repeat-associated protein